MSRLDTTALTIALRRADAELAQQLPRALAFAGDLVVNEARRTTLFRDRTGRLRRSIMRGPVVGSFAAGNLRLDLRVGGTSITYAGAVHDGSRPHEIRPSRRRALRFASAGGFRFAKVVRHPGTAPRPFLTQAVEHAQPRIERALGQAVQLSFARAGFR